MKVDFQDILAALAPGQGLDLIFDIILYIVFFLSMIAMFMQSDKQLITTLIVGSVAACAVIAKLDVLKPKDFGSLIVNAWMFIMPLIAAGLANRDGKKSVPLLIGSGLFAGLYFFMFWFILQR